LRAFELADVADGRDDAAGNREIHARAGDSLISEQNTARRRASFDEQPYRSGTKPAYGACDVGRLGPTAELN
jgi:hypothetical protein